MNQQAPSLGQSVPVGIETVEEDYFTKLNISATHPDLLVIDRRSHNPFLYNAFNALARLAKDRPHSIPEEERKKELDQALNEFNENILVLSQKLDPLGNSQDYREWFSEPLSASSKISRWMLKSMCELPCIKPLRSSVLYVFAPQNLNMLKARHRSVDSCASLISVPHI